MVDLDSIICAYEVELIHWIKEHYLELGYDKIISVNLHSFPDFIFLKDDKEIKVEAEIFASSFIKHKHDSKKVDEILCVIEDKKLPVKTIKIKQLRMWFELEADELVDFFKEMPDSLLVEPKTGNIIDHFQDDWLKLSPEKEEKIRANLREEVRLKNLMKERKDKMGEIFG